MFLIDKKISEMGSSLLKPFDEESVTNIGYDLKTESFFLDANRPRTEVDLAPGDTVFVRTVETITLPDDMAAQVQLKNSRIRQGLSLEAPIYQPGHHTKVFFRVTNITRQMMHLDIQKGMHIWCLFLWERVQQSRTMVHSRTKRILWGWAHTSRRWQMI